jgi:hypothetical protein
VVTAVKDMMEDNKRKRSDREENNRPLHRVIGGRIER